MGSPESNPRTAEVQGLRREGLSIAQIKEVTGIRSNQALIEMLAGTVPSEWTKRPRAKDEKRSRARELRRQGRMLREIAAELGVSLSSASLWTSDVELPGEVAGRTRERMVASSRRRWDATLRRTECERQQTRLAAARQVGPAFRSRAAPVRSRGLLV